MVIHPDDDMARNIRNEQMADGAPSPEESRENARRMLASEGCEVCGEDDPDRLGLVMPHVVACPAYQMDPDDRGTVYCDEHRRSSEDFWWAGMVYRARGQGAKAIAVYDCGAVRFGTMPEFPGGRYNAPDVDDWDDIPPSHRPTPTVPIRCECGARLDRVRYLDGDGR